MMREAILPRRFLRRLRLSESGLALTEFAFSLPIFITLLFGGLEIINLVMAHMRINQIAITVADNAGRARSGIDEADIYEVFYTIYRSYTCVV